MKPPRLSTAQFDAASRTISTQGAWLELHLYPFDWTPPEHRWIVRKRFWRIDATDIYDAVDQFDLALDVSRWAIEEATVAARQSVVVPSPAWVRRRIVPPASPAASDGHRPPSGEGMPQGC